MLLRRKRSELMSKANPAVQCTHCGGEYYLLLTSERRPPVCPRCLNDGHEATHGAECRKCLDFTRTKAAELLGMLKNTVADQESRH
jgi:hypothetical protein